MERSVGYQLLLDRIDESVEECRIHHTTSEACIDDTSEAERLALRVNRLTMQLLACLDSMRQNRAITG